MPWSYKTRYLPRRSLEKLCRVCPDLIEVFGGEVFLDFLVTMLFSFVSLLGFLASVEGAKRTQPNIQARSNYNPKRARSLPAAAQGVQTITTPQNVTIRYKNPGAEGVCETTPGVNSYSGYIDLDVRLSFKPLASSINKLVGKLAHILLVL